eukprot:TRINITY_DN11703_c0_g1_i1.p1 TRINITY_DN11703_c0_g1~~TRINITY_DN11703_c0_g1_i1.p1  ORF type:complete len:258 (-),score=44.94 TRINITY_DN11703_c0_g1_i1:14-736(-)
MNHISRSILPLLRYKKLQVHLPNYKSDTAFHRACQHVSRATAKEILSTMIEVGAQVNFRNDAGECPLHRAVLNQTSEVEVCTFLLEHGANLNQTNYRDESPLHWAVRTGREDLVYLFLKNNVDVNISSVDGTPLTLANLHHNERIARWIQGYLVGRLPPQSSSIENHPLPNRLTKPGDYLPYPTKEEEEMERNKNLYAHIPDNLLKLQKTEKKKRMVPTDFQEEQKYKLRSIFNTITSYY